MPATMIYKQACDRQQDHWSATLTNSGLAQSRPPTRPSIDRCRARVKPSLARDRRCKGVRGFARCLLEGACNALNMVSEHDRSKLGVFVLLVSKRWRRAGLQVVANNATPPFMSRQAFGWIVAVTDHSGTRRYHVAVRNRVEAVSAVRRRVVGANLAHVEAVTMLSQRAVTVLLRLKPGEVTQVV